MFRESAVPESFEFFERLSPLNKRLFIIELWDALSRVAISGGDESVHGLVDLIMSWEATADLDSAPEVIAAISQSGPYRALRIV
jgi:hypothetical protein